MLRSSKVQNGMHVAHIDSFWLSMWIADIVRSAKKIRSQGWDKDERVDRLLFQSQLASADFFGRELNPEASDPQLYVNECSNSIFSLLQKDYAPSRTRAIAATARLEKIPALLVTARANLTQPVKLCLQADLARRLHESTGALR